MEGTSIEWYLAHHCHLSPVFVFAVFFMIITFGPVPRTAFYSFITKKSRKLEFMECAVCICPWYIIDWSTGTVYVYVLIV